MALFTLPSLPKTFLALSLVTLFASTIVTRAGTMVEIGTPVGTMTLELYDDEKPITVANFLAYIESGRYQNIFAHRLEPGFVLQSGGYALIDNNSTSVTTYPPITNEYTAAPQFSNTYGTIAMAKRADSPDSATSQWFLNLGDNSALDSVNGGFTVFGRVVAGLDVLAKFNTDFNGQANGNQGVYNATSSLGSNFANLPLLSNQLTAGNLLYTSVTVDSDPVTPNPAPPRLKIKGKKRVVTKRSRVAIKGSAIAPGGLAQVLYDAPRAKPKNARGGAKWSFKTKVRRGRNLIKIWATDTTGQRSKIQKIRVIRKR